MVLRGGAGMEGIILGITILVFFIVAGAVRSSGARSLEETIDLLGYRSIEVLDEGLRDAIWEAVQQLGEHSSTRNRLRERDIKRIRTLNAMIKGIGTLDGLDFSKLHSLRELNLSYNGITTLNKVDFRGLERLKTLSLTFNVLESLVGVDFNGLDNLVTLDLNENKIEEIEGAEVSHLHSLRNLDLGLNNIVSLEGLDFRGLQSLRYLNLRLNHIKSLKGTDFKELHSLRYLNLDFNRIDTMDGFRGAVEGLTNLTVSMYDNPVTGTKEYNEIAAEIKGDDRNNIILIP